MTDGLRPWSNAEMDMGVFPILNTPARESCGYSSCEHVTVGAYRRDVTLMKRAASWTRTQAAARTVTQARTMGLRSKV